MTSPGAPERQSWIAVHGTTLVCAMALLYAAAYSTLSILKYRYYLYDVFDLAIFVQAMNGMLRGSLFSSLRGMDWLGDHSSLILFLLAPLYAIFRHPFTLLVVQSAALGLGALPVFWLARRGLGDAAAALAFAALYLLYPAVGYANLYEFHPEALCVPLLLFAFHYLLAGRLAPMLLSAGLALLGREDAGLVVCAMGVYALLIPRPGRWALGATLLGAGLAALALSFGVIKPALSAGRADFSLLYSDWGGAPREIVRAIASHPLRAVEWLASTPGDARDTALKQTYYLQMLLPLGFLPLLSPWTLLIATPIVAECFLSRGAEQHTIFYHYTALATPAFVVAAVRGMGNLVNLMGGAGRPSSVPGQGARARQTLAAASAIALLASLASNFAFGPILASGRAIAERPQPTWPTAADRTLRPYRDRMMVRVPALGGVAASFEFQARLASRDDLHSLHHVLSGHYTISRAAYPLPRGLSCMIGEFGPERTLASVGPGSGQRLRDLIAINHLWLADHAGNLMVWLREPGGSADSVETWAAGSFPIADPRRLTYDRQLGYLGAELTRNTVEPGGLLPVRTVWRRVAPADRIFLAAFVLLDERDAPACQSTALLGSPVNPVHLWPDSVEVRTTDRIVIPRGLEPGRYTLAMRVGGWNGRATVLSQCDAPELAANRMLCKLGEIDVAAGSRP